MISFSSAVMVCASRADEPFGLLDQREADLRRQSSSEPNRSQLVGRQARVGVSPGRERMERDGHRGALDEVGLSGEKVVERWSVDSVRHFSPLQLT
jgi:hypothetical protein